jgi:hypothetical protein
MPSQAHAVLVDLFRQSQSLTLDLLRTAGVQVRNWQPTIVDSTRPVTSSDYHVDLAVRCSDGRRKTRLLVLVEIQLQTDRDKLRSWPLYQAAARAQYECDACLLVVALTERVARWARKPIPLGPGGSVFRAIVFGPSEVPHHFEHPTPELSLLSGLAHGKTDPVEGLHGRAALPCRRGVRPSAGETHGDHRAQVPERLGAEVLRRG